MKVRQKTVFVIGAQKSGTTSLCMYLGSHPECTLASPKETKFFSRVVNVLQGDYARHYTDQTRIRVDGTTEYMRNDYVPALIKATLGNTAKFVVIMRNPAKRAYSGYFHAVKKGRDIRDPEQVFRKLGPDLNRALEMELQNLGTAAVEEKILPGPYILRYDEPLWPFRYLHNSFYSHHVTRYENMFGAGSVLPLAFEQFLAEPEICRRKLADFLEIDPAGLPDRLPHENITDFLPEAGMKERLKDRIRRWEGYPTHIPRSIRRDIPEKPSSEILSELTALLRPERDYWSERLNLNLDSLGW